MDKLTYMQLDRMEQKLDMIITSLGIVTQEEESDVKEVKK